MPAYNFKPQFADLVANSVKRQTIRPKRKRPTKPGDMIYLYTGMRTTNCRKLGQHICLSVTPIDINGNGVIWVDQSVLSGEQALQLAKDDGFQNVRSLIEFFEATYTLPIIGKMEIIKW